MSEDAFPLEVWLSNTNENSLPANENSLRIEMMNRLVISNVVTAQPGSPSDGDTYIIAATHTGSQWSTFSPNDLTMFRSGTWYSMAPVEGMVVNLAGALYGFDGAAWTAISGGGGGSGDVVGPSSSTDNTLPRFDGTTGKLIQTSGVIVSDSDEISGYKGNINAQTGTTYTAQQSDSGKIIECNNSSAITLTLPNSLAVGTCFTVAQAGAGQVTFSAASGATLRNRQSHTKLAGQWGMATLYVRANSGGSAAEYVLSGDTTT